MSDDIELLLDCLIMVLAVALGLLSGVLFLLFIL
jgi:hypothetical protein